MDKFCTECGVKVEQNFKFCPNCGSEVNQLATINPESPSERTVSVLFCTNCGDENTASSTVCHSCGAKLDSLKASIKTIIDAPKTTAHQGSEKRKTKKIDKANSKNKQEPPAQIEKKLDSKKLIGYIVGCLVLVFLTLIFSGVIELSGGESEKVITNQQNQSSGIDLSALSKINELKNIVENNPANAAAILDLANLRFDSGFFEDAAKNYGQYLILDPKNADARIDMAVCFYNLQQFDKAESEMLLALEYSPKHQTAYLNLGVVYLAKQNIDKAREWFNKAVELNPNSEIGKKAQSLLQSH